MQQIKHIKTTKWALRNYTLTAFERKSPWLNAAVHLCVVVVGGAFAILSLWCVCPGVPFFFLARLPWSSLEVENNNLTVPQWLNSWTNNWASFQYIVHLEFLTFMIHALQSWDIYVSPRSIIYLIMLLYIVKQMGVCSVFWIDRV